MSLIDRARAFRGSGALDEAAKCYRQVLEHHPENAEALCELGTVCLLRGRPNEALGVLESALQVKPNDFDALLARANTLFALKRYPEAVAGFEQALKINPGSAEAHHNRGAALGVQGRHARALEGFEKAIALKPDYVEAYNSRGNALRALSRRGEALKSFEKAIALKPNDPATLLNQALELRALKRNEEALARLARAIAIRPDLVEAHVQHSEILGHLKQHKEALEGFKRALTLKPRSAELHFGHGKSLAALQRYTEALKSYDQALVIRPKFPDALVKRAQALIELQQPAEALKSFDEALAIRSDLIDALVGRGYVLGQMNRWREAMACYERVVLLEPTCVEAQGNLGLMLLTLGDLSTGWERLEWRWKQPHRRKEFRKFKQPRWLGQVPVKGKTILLYHEQGLGDTLQFVRFAELLANQGAHVIVQAQTPLVPLLHGVRGAERVIGSRDPLPPFDLHCPLMSLPLAFGTTLATIPAKTPYLSAPPERVAVWAERLGKSTTPRVGIAWSGNPKHGNDRNRSISLHKLLPLLSVGAEVVSLQKDVRDADRDVLKANPVFLDFRNELKDFADTAALVSLLDLVVTVDTVPAHLAGALGKPVWVLLPFSPDWRWLLDREDSPWYPTARLFRQPAFGDWEGVVQRVTEAIRARFARDDARGKEAVTKTYGCSRD